VNNLNAIYNGGLAGKFQFFGGATAETTARAADGGSWNGDVATSVYSTNPWFIRGGRSSNGSQVGIFAFNRETNPALEYFGHRTILSGY
jgi:hypothetical protein